MKRAPGNWILSFQFPGALFSANLLRLLSWKQRSRILQRFHQITEIFAGHGVSPHNIVNDNDKECHEQTADRRQNRFPFLDATAQAIPRRPRVSPAGRPQMGPHMQLPIRPRPPRNTDQEAQRVPGDGIFGSRPLFLLLLSSIV